MGDAVNPGGGLIRGDDGGMFEFGFDLLAPLIERFGHAGESVGNRAFGNRHPEHFSQQPAQTLETDMVVVVQIEQKRMDVGPKGCANWHPIGRQGLETLAAMPATATKQFNPNNLRGEKRDLNPVITMTARLALARNIAATILAE